LHISGYSNTGSLNLASCDPLSTQGLDAERAKGKLVTSLGISFLTAFLLSSEFCLFRL